MTDAPSPIQDTENIGAQQALGLGLVVASYGIWGLYPFFWILILHIPIFEVRAHRMIWGNYPHPAV